MISKTCTKCETEKSVSEYYKDKNCRFGVSSQCKVCFKARSKKYHEDNREHCIAKSKARHAKNREDILEKRREDYRLNPRQREYSKLWKSRNKHKVLANVTARKRKIRQATPDLPKEVRQEIYNFYWLAKDLEATSGQFYDVDHIVPINGKDVCGLHVPWNLQVLPSDINREKSNAH